MANELVTKDLMVVDNIEDSFVILFWSDWREEIRFDIPFINRLSKTKGKRYRVIENGKIHYVYDSLYNKIPILSSKLDYFLTNQHTKLRESMIYDCIYILQFIESIKSDIPSRYYPVINEIKNPLSDRLKQDEKNKMDEGEFKLYEVVFPKSIISLIEQKYNTPDSIDAVRFFKSLNEKNGISFDEYIDNWMKRLLMIGD